MAEPLIGQLDEHGGRLLEMVERQLGALPAPAGPVQKSGLDQIGFVHIFKRTLVFLNAVPRPPRPGPAIELSDDREKILRIQ